LVAAVSQAVFYDAAFFLVGGANAFGATNHGASASASDRIAGNRT
jgi:hypothetical protein